MSHPTIAPAAVYVTDTVLTAGALPDLPTVLADAVLGWLHAHGLDEFLILANCPIVRDPVARTITWESIGGRPGSGTVRVVQHAPDDAPAVWPAPFPQVLLDQACPACGHAFPTA